MENNPRDAYERKVRQYLRGVEDAYVFNQSGALYEPKSAETPNERIQHSAGKTGNSPLFVHVLRDWIPIVFSALTFLLLCATVYYAHKQWIEVNKSAAAAQGTLFEIQKQTTLMRQQLEGTYAAIIQVNGPVAATSPINSSAEELAKNIIVSIGLRNDGKVNANNVTVSLKMQVLDLASQQRIGPRWSCEDTFPFIIPNILSGNIPSELIHPMRPSAICQIEGLRDEDLSLIKRLKRTIAIDGQITYENGFTDDTGKPEVRPIPICFRYLPKIRIGEQWGDEGSSHFEPCDDFAIMRQRMTAHMEETRK